MQLKDAHAGVDYIGGKRGKMSLSSSNNANAMDDVTPFASNCSWGESKVKRPQKNKYENKQEKQPAQHSSTLWHGALSLSLPPAEGPMVTCSRKHGGYTMETSASCRVEEHPCITVQRWNIKASFKFTVTDTHPLRTTLLAYVNTPRNQHTHSLPSTIPNLCDLFKLYTYDIIFVRADLYQSCAQQ